MKLLPWRFMILTVFLMALVLTSAFGQSAPAPVEVEAHAADATSPVAEGKSPSPAQEGQQSAAAQFSMIRTIGGLGLVLCLMIGLYFAARRYAPQYFTKGASAKSLKVIETLSMGDKRSISMVEAANRRFLLGNTPHQISLLAVLPDPVSMVSEPEPAATSFLDSSKADSRTVFRNLFEAEKTPPASPMFNPLPEELRAKMRQLRASLER